MSAPENYKKAILCVSFFRKIDPCHTYCALLIVHTKGIIVLVLSCLSDFVSFI